MDEKTTNSNIRRRPVIWLIVPMVLFSALIASWFIWGPQGLLFYAYGLFNSLWLFPFLPFLLLLLIPLAVILLPVLATRAAIRWRRLSGHDRTFSVLFIIATAALVTSSALEFGGMTPAPYDMFARGFARYLEGRADIAAIQTWLGTQDPKEYIEYDGAVPWRDLAESEQPPCIACLHCKTAQVRTDQEGRLVLWLLWDGHRPMSSWGIEVGDKSMQPPPNSEVIEYHPLAPGAWIWLESE